MFNMYRRHFAHRGRGGFGMGSEEELGHDRFNYMNPTVNYDKWPRRLRPKKNSLKTELEAPESPHPSEDNPSASEVRDCNGSLREHQRLLNLRAHKHKCSPRCRVKVISYDKNITVFFDEQHVVIFCRPPRQQKRGNCRKSSPAAR